MLSISHDEVVYGKNSVFDKMPGSFEDKLANLRLLYGYMYTHPGTKLTFMGSEIGQQEEWNFQSSLNWHLLKQTPNKKFQSFFKELNAFYQSNPALYEKAFAPEGFEWVSMDDHENSVLAYLRKGHDSENDILVICNFTPITREYYKLGVPTNSSLKQIFNSDFKKYGSQGVSNKKVVNTVSEEAHGYKQSIRITLPPLSMIAFEKL
jgi:1,4-alpha-glucan branching enzyme